MAGMGVGALVPMAFTTSWAKRGRFGLPLTLVSVLGAALAFLLYPTNGSFGLDPLQAYAIGLIGVLPAFLGGLAGLLLGWLIWRRWQKAG